MAPASAEPTTAEPTTGQPNESAAALSLFEEGRRLVRADDYASACPKFEAAARIHPSPGVLLNLGDCYERTNRTASAWVEFDDAATTAGRMGRQREQAEALRRKGAIEPRLCRLLIQVTSAGDGLTVERDGQAVDRAAWGAAIPVDPGEHRVVVEEPGRIAWEGTVATRDEGRIVVVSVPVLQPAKARATDATDPNADAADAKIATKIPPFESRGFEWTPARVGGAATAGVGVLAIAVGGCLSLVAKAADQGALAESDTTSRHVDSGRAVNEANIATGVIIGGSIVAVAGFVLWLINPRAAPAATHATSSPALSWRME